MGKVTLANKTTYVLVDAVPFSGAVEIPVPDMTDFNTAVLYFATQSMPANAALELTVNEIDSTSGLKTPVGNTPLSWTGNNAMIAIRITGQPALTGVSYEVVYNQAPNFSSANGAIVTATWIAGP